MFSGSYFDAREQSRFLGAATISCALGGAYHGEHVFILCCVAELGIYRGPRTEVSLL